MPTVASSNSQHAGRAQPSLDPKGAAGYELTASRDLATDDRCEDSGGTTRSG